MKAMKAQPAFEYMLIVIIALAFMIPVWVYVTSVKTETTDELSLSYAKNAVEKMASTADLVYSQGPPAKVKVKVYIPNGVYGFNVTNNTIILDVMYMGNLNPVFGESRARLNGTLPTAEGNYWMQIEAVDNENYDIFIQAV
jgi:uncharacterized protein (UPF0333 family)